MGVTDAAARLGVAPSTAHRLLTMLVYRNFAEQRGDRRYVAGPLLRPFAGADPVVRLRGLALPHLRDLVRRTGETASLMVLRGTHVQMVETVECDHLLRVGEREGWLLPAHLASGGQALLAQLAPAELEALFADEERTGVCRADLDAIVQQTRKRGFAMNDQATEDGVTAVGVAIHGLSDPPVAPAAALAVAMPTVRYHSRLLPNLVAALNDAAHALDQSVRASADQERTDRS
jgi:DNA-binding IclR family transcriptional regulator